MTFQLEPGDAAPAFATGDAEAYYGQDIGDHLPLERIETYLQEQS